MQERRSPLAFTLTPLARDIYLCHRSINVYRGQPPLHVAPSSLPTLYIVPFTYSCPCLVTPSSFLQISQHYLNIVLHNLCLSRPHFPLSTLFPDIYRYVNIARSPTILFGYSILLMKYYLSLKPTAFPQLPSVIDLPGPLPEKWLKPDSSCSFFFPYPVHLHISSKVSVAAPASFPFSLRTPSTQAFTHIASTHPLHHLSKLLLHHRHQKLQYCSFEFNDLSLSLTLSPLLLLSFVICRVISLSSHFPHFRSSFVYFLFLFPYFAYLI